MITPLVLMLAVTGTLSPSPRLPSNCNGAPLSIGARFIPTGGKTETVKSVATVKYGPDTVGFLYRSSANKLYAQARSGMSLNDQRLAGITRLLPDHKTGKAYIYSAIVPIRVNPWRDLMVTIC
jgi:hypothetical protein